MKAYNYRWRLTLSFGFRIHYGLVSTILLLLLFRMPLIGQGEQKKQERPNNHPKLDLHAEALRFRRLKLQDENGKIPTNAWVRAAQERKQMRYDAAAWPHSRLQNLERGTASLQTASSPTPKTAGIQSSGWTWLGPGNIGGRVRSILIHPTTPSIMWVGSVGGGVWKTITAGASWFPLDDFMPNLAISCMVMDPANSDVIYAGTGEGYGNWDAIRGAGVFRTTDGGSTWIQVSSTITSDFNMVNRLAISPGNSQVLLAATSTGIFRSTDGGATWPRQHVGGAFDVAFDPRDGSRCIAAGSGFGLFSIDGGQVWTPASGLPSGRVEIAYAPSNPNIVYASVDQNSGEIWRSLDGGQSYTRRNTGDDYLEEQGWYDNSIWVDPTDPNRLIVGGIDLWRSTDGGASLSKISNWTLAPAYSAHADHHVIINHPAFDGRNNQTLYFGNDGGIYRATDEGDDWIELNNGLGITEFNGVAGSPLSGTMIGGTQDNGTLRHESSDSSSWTSIYGGDGGFCAIHPTHEDYMYGEYVYLKLFRSLDGGTTTELIYFGISDEGSQNTANFIAPFILDPNEPARVLAGGLSLWRSGTSLITTWSAIKPPVGSLISAIAVAPGNSDVIWVGHNDGSLYSTSNGTADSPTWTLMSRNVPGLPGRYCTRIAIEPGNWNHVYVTFGGFTSGNVWRTMNGGATWADLSSNLPQAPVNSIVIDPSCTSRLYVGTEVGVFASADGGATWSPSNDGPANVAAYELCWVGDTLVAATHGRGCFAIKPTEPNGESPLNAGIYKACHNSYERGESLSSQIDDYNEWCIELDIWPKGAGFTAEITVSHTCGLLPLGSSLRSWLQSMNQSSIAQYRPTVLYLEMKGGEGCMDWSSDRTYRGEIKQILADTLGLGNIYPAAEFKTRDGFYWPSYQELARRGYKWMVILDEPHKETAIDDDFFFGVASNDPPPSTDPPNTVLVNIDGGCDASPTDHLPAALNGRWLYRLYPGACTVNSCQEMDGTYWQNGLAKRYNFIASNCVNQDHTFQPPTHSPDPLFVNQFTAVNCPPDNSSCDWGTLGFPYHALSPAIERASPNITVMIQAGQYQLTTSGNAQRIDKALVLKSRAGAVTIR